MRFEEDFIQFKKSVPNWEEAVKLSSEPLLKENIINANYVNKMISNIKEMGPYVVISKDIALPHARPEDGAFESAFSILKLEERISFGNDKKVNVIITLASSKNSDHLETLKFISTLLSEEDNYKKVIESNSSEEIFQLFKKGGSE